MEVGAPVVSRHIAWSRRNWSNESLRRRRSRHSPSLERRRVLDRGIGSHHGGLERSVGFSDGRRLCGRQPRNHSSSDDRLEVGDQWNDCDTLRSLGIAHLRRSLCRRPRLHDSSLRRKWMGRAAGAIPRYLPCGMGKRAERCLRRWRSIRNFAFHGSGKELEGAIQDVTRYPPHVRVGLGSNRPLCWSCRRGNADLRRRRELEPG